MLKDSLNKKTYIGDIEPNPKEFGIWIKEDGSASIYDYIKNEWKGSSSDNDGGEASSIEYLDITNISSYKELFLQNSLRACVISDDIKVNSTPFAVYATIMDLISYKSLYIQIDFKYKIYGIQSGQTLNLTVMELLNMGGITQEQLDAIPRITKEQFYSLES